MSRALLSLVQNAVRYASRLVHVSWPLARTAPTN